MTVLQKKGEVDQFGYSIKLKKNTNKSSTELEFVSYVRHFRIYESLFSKFMYVEGLIVDGGGLIQRVGIQAGDILSIDLFKDPSDTADEKISKDFYIEHLGGEDRSDGEKAARYTFRAVSKTGFEAQKNKVKKAFFGPTTSIIQDIAVNYLKATPEDLDASNFTESSGSINYIASSVSPFEAIECLGKQSISKENPKEAGFAFYETRDGLFFKPLGPIVASGKNFPYIKAVDKNKSQEGPDKDYYRVNDLQHHISNDQRENLKKGALKNKTVSFNFISRKVDETVFDIREQSKEVLVMGPNLLIDEEELNNLIGGNVQGDEDPNLYVRCNNQSYDQVEDFFAISRGPSQAQKILMNQTVVTIKVHGNPKLKPGDTIELDVNQPSAESRKQVDFVLSGKFLVGSVVNSVTDLEDYITICDLFKDGYERSITDYRTDINSHFVKPRE